MRELAHRDTERRVLVVDDDPIILRFAVATLSADGFDAHAAASAEEGFAQIERYDFQLVLTDLVLPGMSGLDLLAELKRSDPDMPVIMMTAFGTIESAVEAMRKGAFDYITKPLNGAELQHRVRRALRVRGLVAENRWLHRELAAAYSPGRIIAVSSVMRDLIATVEKLAESDATVLISGESGTGKELMAKALHFGGPRSQGPFIAVNCAAMPAGLVESELFGHAKGAFTGAVHDRPGKLEAAHRGTLFLDEVGELPLETQPKLLRALQERTFERVGEHRLRRVDVRFVAASNRDLMALVRDGGFREDLYFRLAVVPITVPPLRDRPEDIPVLARYFLSRIAGDDAPQLSDDAALALQRHPWRGNVRELSNTLERSLALHSGGTLAGDDLHFEGVEGAKTEAPSNSGSVVLPEGGAALDDMVRDLVVQALERTNWNQTAAARLLRIPRHIIQYRMAKYGIVPANRPGRGSSSR